MHIKLYTFFFQSFAKISQLFQVYSISTQRPRAHGLGHLQAEAVICEDAFCIH